MKVNVGKIRFFGLTIFEMVYYGTVMTVYRCQAKTYAIEPYIRFVYYVPSCVRCRSGYLPY